jgi:1A family penicillin-binding protein
MAEKRKSSLWESCRFWLKDHLLLLTVFAILAGLGSLSFFYVFKDLPSPTQLSRGQFPVSTQIFDRHGTLLYEIYTDQNRTPIKLAELPEYVKQATIAIEDKDFYHHQGFAFRGIMRAGYQTLLKQDLQGGSTITQQLVKTALLTPERTLKRKIREALLAWAVEIIYTKDEILEMYLNHIPYGGTAYGIEQAAQRYFGKPAKDLNLAEATLLAGLPQAPTRFSPFGAHPELAKDRQTQVLERMVEDGYITPEQKQATEKEPLTYAPQRTDIKAPHFVLYVRDLLVEKYGQQVVEQGGLRVTTTLDLNLQNQAQASLSAEITKLEPLRVSNGAALVTKPPTGEILAMVGSRDYFDTDNDGNVNVTTSLRQPGSSIKPINYTVGLLQGYTAGTMFLDIPTCFAVENQPLYCPHNYDGNFHGPVSMRQALGNSYNIPAVKMLALNGVEAMMATGSAMGITTWTDPSHYGLSLTLGGGEVKMVDMAVAFGVFANQGRKVPLNPILKVEDYQGNVLETYEPEKQPVSGERVLAAEIAYLISDILSDNGARTAAFGPSSELVIPQKIVAVKTGTTDNLRDNWTIGYTPSYLTAVWVGNNDNTPMNPWLVSGITGAAPIWHDIMSLVLAGQSNEAFTKPQNVVSKPICYFPPEPQENADPNAPTTCQGQEQFIEGTQQNIFGWIKKKETWIDKATQRPPEESKTDNLELQEKLLASDMFTIDYCLDCNHEQEPARVVQYQQFRQTLEEKLKKIKESLRPTPPPAPSQPQ